ncbi:MAG: metal-dependent transcriptional regulator [Thermoprotei archaeon]|nr:MAG: metal-dependent transcriptional regulator [Thermoprotei archaeon]
MENLNNKKEYKLTKSLEDYMRAIYILSKRNKVVRVKNIAKLLKVKPSSVTFALRKLSGKGLIEYEKHGYIDLTEEGLKVASKLSDRYRSIEHFLENILGLPREIAEIDACNIEHHLHDETISRIEVFVEFIEKKPERVKLINEFLKYYKKNLKR